MRLNTMKEVQNALAGFATGMHSQTIPFIGGVGASSNFPILIFAPFFSLSLSDFKLALWHWKTSTILCSYFDCARSFQQARTHYDKPHT